MIRVRLLVLLGLFELACGGSSDGSLYGKEKGSGGNDAGGGSSSGTGGAALASGGSAASGGSTGEGGATGGAPSAGGLTGSGATLGSGGAIGPDGSTGPGGSGGGGGAPSTGGAGNDGGTPDGGAQPTPGVLVCAGVPCIIPGTVPYECCIAPPAPFPVACYPTFPGCVTGGMAVTCDDTADCPSGSMCCASFTSPATGAVCAKTCKQSEQRLCRIDAECSTGLCLPLAAYPDYSACQ